MGGTYDPPERNDDQDDNLRAGEEVREILRMRLRKTLERTL
jgi:hypothetical protein